jgi:hypothetical protein
MAEIRSRLAAGRAGVVRPLAPAWSEAKSSRNRVFELVSQECFMSSSPPSVSSASSFTAQPNAGSPDVPADEVVTMLGDSVVGVAHLEPAARAPSRTHGYLALALGALLLLVAGVAFARGLSTAAANQRAFAEWRDVLGRPVHEFRPARLHPIHDWMALAGLAGGFLALTWGATRLRARALRDTFTIGTDPGADASVASTPDKCPPKLALVRWDASGPLVCVPEGMRARMHRDGRAYEIDELTALGVARAASLPGGRELAVPPGGSVRVDVGPAAFVVRMVTASRPRALFGLRMPERQTMAFWLGSLAAHLALIALIRAIPPDPASLTLGLDTSNTRMIMARAMPAEDQKVDPSNDPQGNAGAAGMSLPGRVETLAPPSSGGGPRSREPLTRPPGSRAEAQQMARTEGMLAFLGSNPRVFDPLAEIGDFQAEPGAITDYGVPVGAGIGNNWGLFGSGPGGFALQGGGTVTSGHYETIGGSGKPGDSYTGYGGCCGRARHQPGVPSVRISDARADGALDPKMIRSRITQQRERIRHCYERTLLTTPELTGTVTTNFVISPEGKVIQASASGIGHDGLEACIADVVQNISFPRASTSQLTKVTYPFELRNTGR